MVGSPWEGRITRGRIVRHEPARAPSLAPAPRPAPVRSRTRAGEPAPSRRRGRWRHAASQRLAHRAGRAVSPDGSRLYAVHALGELLSVLDLTQEEPVARSVSLPAEGYTAVVSPDGRALYVSLWGGAKVLVFDPATLEKQAEIAVGEH